jgi:hypothetical protein
LYLMLGELTAGPSTSLRSGRDDNQYLGTGCECSRKIAIRKKSQALGMTKGGRRFHLHLILIENRSSLHEA